MTVGMGTQSYMVRWISYQPTGFSTYYVPVVAGKARAKEQASLANDNTTQILYCPR